MMLCKFCTDIDLDALDSIEGYHHHGSVKDLQESASNGCESCFLIQEAHQEHEGGLLQESGCGSAEDTQVTMHLTDIGMIEVSQIKRRKSNNRPFLNSIVHFCAQADDPMAECIPKRPVDLPPASGNCFSAATRWLQACLERHSNCIQEGLGSKPLPARVIDVGPPDGSKAPFLHITNGEGGLWVTLSHCWGGTDPLKTTLESMAKYKEALPMGDLPPLFRDAVLITRRLNYRYLWIDSLCIIQDSESDWQTESANMGYIYSNAVFAIAAEAASNSEEGILDITRPSVTYPVRVACHTDRIQGNMIFYRARYDIKGSLSTRAWTLQEDVLSARVLRWGTKQVTWHCRTATCSEQNPTDAFNIDSKGYTSSEKLYRKPYFKLLCLSREALQRYFQGTGAPGSETGYQPSALTFWDSIVHDFASRALTYDTDRLPALSGLAKEVARHTSYTYKAGLWEEEIHSDLLWRVEDKGQASVRYTAPSWTWAGHNLSGGKAKLATMSSISRRYAFHTVAEILSIDLVYKSRDIFGQVTSGQLTLRGPCLQIAEWDTISLRFDCLLDSEGGTSGNILCVQILCFPTRKWFSALRKQHFEGETCALLLEPVENTDDIYRRVGIARIPATGQVTDERFSRRFWGAVRQRPFPILRPGEVWNTRTLAII